MQSLFYLHVSHLTVFCSYLTYGVRPVTHLVPTYGTNCLSPVICLFLTEITGCSQDMFVWLGAFLKWENRCLTMRTSKNVYKYNFFIRCSTLGLFRVSRVRLQTYTLHRNSKEQLVDYTKCCSVGESNLLHCGWR